MASNDEVKEMEGKFTAVFEKDGDWWIGYIEEMPGANTQGKTLEETRENLLDALTLLIEANRGLARQEFEREGAIHEEIVVAV